MQADDRERRIRSLIAVTAGLATAMALWLLPGWMGPWLHGDDPHPGFLISTLLALTTFPVVQTLGARLLLHDASATVSTSNVVQASALGTLAIVSHLLTGETFAGILLFPAAVVASAQVKRMEPRVTAGEPIAPLLGNAAVWTAPMVFIAVAGMALNEPGSSALGVTAVPGGIALALFCVGLWILATSTLERREWRRLWHALQDDEPWVRAALDGERHPDLRALAAIECGALSRARELLDQAGPELRAYLRTRIAHEEGQLALAWTYASQAMQHGLVDVHLVVLALELGHPVEPWLDRMEAEPPPPRERDDPRVAIAACRAWSEAAQGRIQAARDVLPGEPGALAPLAATQAMYVLGRAHEALGDAEAHGWLERAAAGAGQWARLARLHLEREPTTESHVSARVSASRVEA